MNDPIGIMMRGFAGLAIVFAFVSSTPPVAVAQTSANPAEGHRLALKICSACHVVAADQQLPPLLRHPAPNFRAISAKPGINEASLQQFILTTHSAITNPEGMPNPQLTADQAADIASYIVSLRSARRAAPK
jgi:mono/diheme cytochrome c family protein